MASKLGPRAHTGSRLAATIRFSNGNGMRFSGAIGTAAVVDPATGRFTISGRVTGPITSLTRRWPKGCA